MAIDGIATGLAAGLQNLYGMQQDQRRRRIEDAERDTLMKDRDIQRQAMLLGLNEKLWGRDDYERAVGMYDDVSQAYIRKSVPFGKDWQTRWDAAEGTMPHLRTREQAARENSNIDMAQKQWNALSPESQTQGVTQYGIDPYSPKLPEMMTNAMRGNQLPEGVAGPVRPAFQPEIYNWAKMEQTDRRKTEEGVGKGTLPWTALLKWYSPEDAQAYANTLKNQSIQAGIENTEARTGAANAQTAYTKKRMWITDLQGKKIESDIALAADNAKLRWAQLGEKERASRVKEAQGNASLAIRQFAANTVRSKVVQDVTKAKAGAKYLTPNQYMALRWKAVMTGQASQIPDENGETHPEIAEAAQTYLTVLDNEYAKGQGGAASTGGSGRAAFKTAGPKKEISAALRANPGYTWQSFWEDVQQAHPNWSKQATYDAYLSAKRGQ